MFTSSLQCDTFKRATTISPFLGGASNIKSWYWRLSRVSFIHFPSRQHNFLRPNFHLLSSKWTVTWVILFRYEYVKHYGSRHATFDVITRLLIQNQNFRDVTSRRVGNSYRSFRGDSRTWVISVSLGMHSAKLLRKGGNCLQSAEGALANAY